MTAAWMCQEEHTFGVVSALVTDVDDPDRLGRVQVWFPWFGPGYEEWARIAQPYAGPEYGSTWIPEVDTEVLVAFDHGDMRLPFVLGCLYNGVDKPKYPRNANTDVKSLRTPKGSELKFDEKTEKVTLTTPEGASIELDEKAAQITITAAQTLVLKADSVRIEGTTEVVVSGGTIALN